MRTRLSQFLVLLFLGSVAAFSQTFTDGPSVAVNADGRLEIFARGSDQALWHNWQTSPGGSWSGWYSLGGIIFGAPAATVNADGRLDVFVLGSWNTAFHNYQVSPGGGWSGWISIGGGIASPPSVATNADGRLEIFAEGTDCAVWHSWQTIPGGDLNGWTSLGGCISDGRPPSVAQNADGRLEIFILGGGPAYHNWQGSPGGGWNGWATLGGSLASTPAAAINNDGRLEIFAQGTDNAAWHSWQTSPGGTWTDWSSLGGSSAGPPSIEADGNGSLTVFALGAGNGPYYITQGNGWAGWNYLGGVINAAPGIEMNFDGRLEIFGVGTDGNVYHDWQLSAAGSWSGWQLLGTPSNSGTTNGADAATYLTDSQNDANFSSAGNGTPPPWLSASTAWPCGARVNIGITGYNKRDLRSFQAAITNWNSRLLTYYSNTYNSGTVPVQLYISAGGPQTLVVSRIADNDPSLRNPNDPSHPARAITGSWQQDSTGRLMGAVTNIIRGMRNHATLTNAFAHELGHTFGLFDCTAHPSCGTASVSPVTHQYTVTSYSVMDAKEPAPPDSNGWDDAAKNFTEGTEGPLNADLQVIDSHLPDYTYCIAEDAPPPPVPQCTNGTVLAFTDTGQNSSYTCGGSSCDGCNPNCNNFAPQKCTGGGGGSPTCSQWCGSVCMDNVSGS